MNTLIYVADPMCSWCYGFGPELDGLLRLRPELQVELVMGGLRAYNTQPLDDTLRETVRAHWHRIGAMTGLPFCEDALHLPDFVYDTEPACRAVVAVRRLAPQAGLAAFSAIQQAFYAKAQDTTQSAPLAHAVAPMLKSGDTPVPRTAFVQEWSHSDTRNATRADFEQAKHWGVTGFPTLLLQRENKLHLLAAGFARTTQLDERLETLLQNSSGAVRSRI